MEILLGAHMSINGGLHTALERGASIGCTAIQIFTKNANQWRSSPLSETDVATYKRVQAKARIHHVVTHASYLINLCSTNKQTAHHSRVAFIDELRRCDALGIGSLIFHPGSHTGAGEEAGLSAIADALNRAHEETPGCRTLSTLENTAGQGTNLGYRFEQLATIIDLVKAPERMAVCIDTCHLFASGYPIHTEGGWGTTMDEFQRILGIERITAIHLNDSIKEFGSKRDRHAHIGKGQIGLLPFRALMNDRRFDAVPKVLETEKDELMTEDVENMATLMSLIEKPD